MEPTSSTQISYYHDLPATEISDKIHIQQALCKRNQIDTTL